MSFSACVLIYTLFRIRRKYLHCLHKLHSSPLWFYKSFVSCSQPNCSFARAPELYQSLPVLRRSSFCLVNYDRSLGIVLAFLSMVFPEHIHFHQRHTSASTSNFQLKSKVVAGAKEKRVGFQECDASTAAITPLRCFQASCSVLWVVRGVLAPLCRLRGAKFVPSVNPMEGSCHKGCFRGVPFRFTPTVEGSYH